MMATSRKLTFSVVFKKGLANRNRLPLDHVITTLQQIQHMIREVGRKIQRDAGEEPTGDFGIELLAGGTGLAFQKGSLQTDAVVTKNFEMAIPTLNTIIHTTDLLQRKREKDTLAISDYGEEVLRRLPKIAAIQAEDKTELHLTLKQGRKVVTRSHLGERGRKTLESLEDSEFTIEAVTLYGKLRELRDISRSEEQSGHFWGELLEDNGHYWRVRFSDSDQKRVLELFRKQVWIAGDATYYKTRAPRLEARDIREEAMPDYLAAFDRFSEAYSDLFADADVEEVLADIRD
jgi:hypothetical protein